MKRRDFLKTIGVATSGTLLGGCVEKGEQKIIAPLDYPAKGIIPGVAHFVNTTCAECPAFCGVKAKVLDGDTKKLEGIARHPINDGSLCVRGQASITRLYNPQRVRGPMIRDTGGKFRPVTWAQVYQKIQESLATAREQHLRNLYFSGRTTGSIVGLIGDFCSQVGFQQVPEYEVFDHATLREVNRILFGRREVPNFASGIGTTDFLFTIGADIFETFVSPVAHANALSQAKNNPAFRWAHVEPHVSLAGLKADMPLRVHPGSEALLLAFLLNCMVAEGWYSRKLPTPVRSLLPSPSMTEAANQTGLSAKQINQLITPLRAAKKPMLIAGGVSLAQPTGLETAVLAGLIQWLSGMTDQRVDFVHAENYDNVGTLKDVDDLNHSLQSGTVGVIIMTRTDPVATLPAAFSFGENLKKANLRIGLTDILDATMRECDLILPLSHSLEAWGDAEPRRGLRTFMQPTRERLFDTKTEGDILLDLLRLAGKPTPAASYQAYLHQRWAQTHGIGALAGMLERGYHEASVPPVSVQLNAASTAACLATAQFKPASATPILIVAPSLRGFDGRSRSLGLLSEVPDPVTTITYGEWVSVSEGSAQAMRLAEGDEVQVATGSWSARLPVKIQPRLSDKVVVVQHGILSNPPVAMDQRTGGVYASVAGVNITRTGQRIALPIMSGSLSQQGRGIIPNPEHLKEQKSPDPQGAPERRPSLYEEQEYEHYRWAMAIDLDKCTGCSACVAACYVENNVPLVGEDQHVLGREMSWIRIEPFYDAAPGADFIPMLCQQCDRAPCESVCPVYATYHSPEGLNVQVYNRCVGTRYCSNNCPYKVRRFNWFDHQWKGPLDKMVNPEMSKRGRGVMEKCTFCIHRVRAGKDHAKDESRLVQDGEVTPACAQSCPSKAIVFGNARDENSAVSEAIHSDRSYQVFDELGTEPAVYYLGGRRKKNEV